MGREGDPDLPADFENTDLGDGACAIDVALDEVTTETVLHAHGTLKVDARPNGKSTGCGLAKCLGNRSHGKGRVCVCRDRKADAVDGDRCINGNVVHDDRCFDHDLYAIGERCQINNGTNVFDKSGKHQLPLMNALMRAMYASVPMA